MSDDLLARATRALRESDDEAAPPPVLDTRHRIVATLRQKRSSRVVWLRRVLPIAAILVTSSAWAAANGHLGGTMRQVAALVGLADEADSGAAPAAPSQLAAKTPAPRVNDGAPVSAPSEAPPAPEEAAPPEVQGPSPPVAEPVVASPAASSEARTSSSAARPSSSSPEPSAQASSKPVGSGSAAPRASASADDPAQPLYASAHQKHFAERDYAGALAAWEKYLRAAPGGRFAAEAQYNRAICLVRLGRKTEAKPALRAFAEGGYGGYRQSEAKALLDALDGP